MTSILNSFYQIFIVVSCLALINRGSNAFLLGNIIGCNSFGCRLAALETEVNQLKNQVQRLQFNKDGMNNNQNGMNDFNNNQGMNNNRPMNNNQQQNQNQQPNQSNGQQQQGTASMMSPNELNRVYGNLPLLDYNQQAMRRTNSNTNSNDYLNRINNNQFFRA